MANQKKRLSTNNIHFARCPPTRTSAPSLSSLSSFLFDSVLLFLLGAHNANVMNTIIPLRKRKRLLLWLPIPLSFLHQEIQTTTKQPKRKNGREIYTRKKRYTYKDESNYYKTLCACFAMQHSWHDLCLCICTVKEIYGYIKTLPIPMIGMCTLRHCFQTLTPCIVFWSLSIQKYIYPQHC